MTPARLSLLLSLMLHGFLGVWVYWQTLLPTPPRSAGVSVVDFSGQGESEASPLNRKPTKPAKRKSPSGVKTDPLALAGQSAFDDEGEDDTLSEAAAAHPDMLEIIRYAKDLRVHVNKGRASQMKTQAVVRVQISRDGVFQSREIAESSGDVTSDQEALTLIDEIKSFRPLPTGYSGSGVFLVIVKF